MTLKTLPLSDPYGSVAYRAAGLGAPVVLIHGVGMQSAAWGPQIKALSQTHRVIALDMPGHGGSSTLPQGSTLTDYVAWLHAVLVAADLNRVSLAGHSMGALIAGGFAASHPRMVSRVALLNGVFRRDAPMRAAVEARAAAIRAGRLDTETPLQRWFGDSDLEASARRQVAQWLNAVDPVGYATAYTAFAGGNSTYAERFGAISCPLLAITGDSDPNSTPAMARAMADAAPQGRAVIVEGHRHMVNLTAPELINAELRRWLETDCTLEETS